MLEDKLQTYVYQEYIYIKLADDNLRLVAKKGNTNIWINFIIYRNTVWVLVDTSGCYSASITTCLYWHEGVTAQICELGWVRLCVLS